MIKAAVKILVLLACSSVCLAQDDVEIPARLKSWSAEDRLLFLATMRSTDLEDQWYEEALESIRARPSESAIKAIEALLNRDEFRNDAYRGEMAGLLRMFRAEYSRIWYEWQWPRLDAAGRVRIALYAMQPAPPVYVDHGVGLEYALRLQGGVRKAVYEIMTDPTIKSELYGWSLISSSYMQELITKQKILWPTDEETEAISKPHGTFGKYVLLKHFAELGDLRGIDLSRSWMDEHKNDLRMLRKVLTVGRNYKGANIEVRIRLADDLAEIGVELLDEMGMGKNQNDNILRASGVISVLYSLEALGKTDRGLQLVKRLVDPHDGLKKIDSIKQDPVGTGEILKQKAFEILEKWNEK